MLSDPILNITAACNSIGKRPIQIRMLILFPGSLRKYRKTYKVANK